MNVDVSFKAACVPDATGDGVGVVSGDCPLHEGNSVDSNELWVGIASGERSGGVAVKPWVGKIGRVGRVGREPEASDAVVAVVGAPGKAVGREGMAGSVRRGAAGIKNAECEGECTTVELGSAACAVDSIAPNGLIALL
jgi:hypothetical protein